MKSNTPHALMFVLAAFATLGAGAADRAINAAKSSVIATFKQENVPVDATFKSFTGYINYDPAQPAAGKAELQVETGSFDIGSPEYSAEVRKKQWFDSATYPKASFVATAIKSGAAGQLSVSGTFTLKGKTQPLTIPVTVAKSGTATTYDGTFEISRKAFGIGDPVWDEVVDDKVKVRFHFVQ